MTLPIGAIVMFYDNIANRPTGWEICNGSNGTPDLRSKFIYAASADGEVGNTGGASSHLHTNPSSVANSTHTHSTSFSVGGSSGTTAPSPGGGGGIDVASSGHSHSASATSDAGGSHQHAIADTSSDSVLPPYVKVYFIMRTV